MVSGVASIMISRTKLGHHVLAFRLSLMGFGRLATSRRRSRPDVPVLVEEHASSRHGVGVGPVETPVPSRRSVTSFASLSTARCCEIAGRVTSRKLSAMSVAGSSCDQTSRRIARRRGSASALRARPHRLFKQLLT